MNMPPMNFDAARMNSMGPDEYQVNQAIQQQQASGAANAMTQNAQAAVQEQRVMSELQAAQSSHKHHASDFVNARIAALKNATTGNQGEQRLRQMDPKVLQRLVNSL